MDFSKYERLKNGIQVFKRKNKNPLEFAVKHIVTCLRDHSNDLVKIADFHNIFDTLASTCPEIVSNPQLGLPSQHVDRLENLVKQLITQGMVDKALELTTAPYPVPYRLPFLELQMQVYYHERNMEKFWKNVEVLESEKKVAYLETYYIWGTSLKDLGGERNLQKAINVFDKGMSEASREENQSLIERIKEEKKKVEKALKSPTEAAAPVHIAPQDVQNAPEAMQQAEEAKRLEIEEELLAGEEAAKAARILSESKGKAKKQKGRKGIQISEIKKAVEVEDESDGRVLEGKIQEKGSRSKLAVESRLQKRKFEVAFDVTIEDVDEKSSFGSTKTNTSEVRKSFIVAEPSHIINIQDLVDLCLTHENLLKIDQSLKPCDRSSPMLLTSEDVCSIHRFFECKWSEISLQSNEDWWIAIKDMFWKVFRCDSGAHSLIREE